MPQKDFSSRRGLKGIVILFFLYKCIKLYWIKDCGFDLLNCLYENSNRAENEIIFSSVFNNLPLSKMLRLLDIIIIKK